MSRAARLSLLAVLPALALAGCDRAPVDTSADAPEPGTPSGELVVDLVDGTTLAEFTARFGLAPTAARWNSPNVEDEAIAVLRLEGDQAALLASLRADPMVEAAEPNYLVTIEPESLLAAGGDMIPEDQDPKGTDVFPNDPFYAKQWNMEMVHARDAWRYSTGEDVIVAIIDTGVGYEGTKRGPSAPDLQLTRFVPGYDFVNDDHDAGDDHGHGTHCAGTVAQSTNNGRGVIGLAHGARIMPLKVLSASGWGSTVDIADAIRFAADHGAHVLSLSLGGGGHSKILADAVGYARGKGCMVVCAAGNGGRARVEYPAAYAGATAVSSVGPKGTLAFYSSHGKQTFIAAPGGDKSQGTESGVLQNTIDARGKRTVYAWWQGTSMATPHVAAASALLYECGVTRPDAVESILQASASTAADTKESGWSQRYGWGILDAGAAVRRALFLPGWVALGLSALLVFVASRRLNAHDAVMPLVCLGALAASSGLFFLRPLGLGELPIIGGFVTRGIADWDIPLFGARWHWTPLFASALIPAFAGLVAVKSRALRSLALGLILGWAARLVTGIVLPWADVRLIPGHGLFDMIWLAGNAAVLVAWAAVVVRLGRGRSGVTL
jgi:serine protease